MKPKALTEGALLCALSVVLALMCYYLPFMIVLYIFIPIPIIVLCRRQGFAVSMISSVAAMFILFFLIDVVSAATFGMYMILVGCGLGYAYYKGKNGFSKMVAGYLSILITLFGMLIIAQVVTGQNFIEMTVTQMTEMSHQVVETYKEIGLLSPEQIGTMEGTLEQFMSSVKMTIPLSFLMAPFFIAWINIIFSDKLLKRLGMSVDPLPPLSAWRVPKSLKNVLVIVVVFLLIKEFGGFKSVPEIYSYTLMQLAYYVYVAMGFSFVFWWMNRKKKKESVGLKVLIVVISILIPFASYLISMLGVADIYINLRLIIQIKDEYKK